VFETWVLGLKNCYWSSLEIVSSKVTTVSYGQTLGFPQIILKNQWSPSLDVSCINQIVVDTGDRDGLCLGISLCTWCTRMIRNRRFRNN
jgi:hypothetical protein